MAAIAIIDDDVEQSGTLKTALDHYLSDLESNLDVITRFPFGELREYFNFVTENEVCVLVLDERLNNQASNGVGPVDYRGTELVSYLRARLKDFPIFAVSGYTGDDELLEKSSEFEYIIERVDFIDNGAKYVPILIRAAQRYLDSNSKELAEFEVLTKVVASGKAKSKQVSRLRALQAKLELPFSGFDDRTAWLNKYSEQISELEALKNQLRKKLRKKK